MPRVVTTKVLDLCCSRVRLDFSGGLHGEKIDYGSGNIIDLELMVV